MLGRQPFLRLIEGGRLRCGVLKRFERADRIVLVDVGRRISQGLDPIARKHRGVLLGAALRRRDDRPALVRPARAMDPPLELVVLTIS